MNKRGVTLSEKNWGEGGGDYTLCFDVSIFCLLSTEPLMSRIAKGTRRVTVVATATIVAGLAEQESKTILSSDTGIDTDTGSDMNDSLRFDKNSKSLTSLTRQDGKADNTFLSEIFCQSS